MRLFSIVQASVMLFLLFSCKAQPVAKQGQSTTPAITDQEKRIVYLFFEIQKDTNGPETVKLTDTKITPGTFKNASLENKEKIAGNIAVTFLSQDGNIISERIIEDPLNPMMETYTQGGLGREKLNLQKAEFSIRFNQTGNISAVQLEKITPNSKTQLITIQL